MQGEHLHSKQATASAVAVVCTNNLGVFHSVCVVAMVRAQAVVTTAVQCMYVDYIPRSIICTVVFVYCALSGSRLLSQLTNWYMSKTQLK
jgi:hypothetical protein